MTQPFLAFAIDSADRSGFALADNARVCSVAGVATTSQQRHDICVSVDAHRRRSGLPLIVVAETWPGKWRSWKVAFGAGRNWGRWIDHIELILGIKEQWIVPANPQRWRSDLFGKEALKGTDSNAKKRLACAYVGTPDHDQAEAECMALWAYSSEAALDAVEAAVRRLKRVQERE